MPKPTTPRPLKDPLSPEDRAESNRLSEAADMRRQDAVQTMLETGWARLGHAHDQLTQSGRIMVLFGVRALQLKAVLPYGEFTRQLALHCPQISQRSAYRGMQAAHQIMTEGLQFCARGKSGEALETDLGRMADALSGAGEAELASQIDALIDGKSGRQLLLSAKPDKADPSDADEAQAQLLCLDQFNTHHRGAEFEDRWRMMAEAGDLSWSECWRNICSLLANRRDLTEPPSPKHVKDMLRVGIHRLSSWGSADNWTAIDKQGREELQVKWLAALANLHPDLKEAAFESLAKGGRV